MQVIFHIDVNSAFLSWTACARKAAGETPDLRDIPSVIGGNEESRHGIVLAKSTPAKAYQIHTGETLFSARRKCPNLVVVPPDHKLYVKRSSQLIRMLHTYTPKVQQYSIDEAWMDMSGIEEAERDPVGFAHRLKDRISRELGFTVNIGISSNHLLAKMASELKKPDMVHTLFPEEMERKMWPLPVEELFFVGHSSARRLRTLGIHTIGELARMDPAILSLHLKKHGEDIWNYANGRELDASVFEETKTKGYGNAMTVARDIVEYETAAQVLLSLCETVGARLRQDEVKVSVVGVQLKDHQFTGRSRQNMLRYPTNSTNILYEEACRLFREVWDGTPLRLIGVFTSKAAREEYEQLDLFQTAKSEKQGKLDAAIDQIRRKYGDASIKRACFLESGVRHMAGGLNREKQRLAGQERRASEAEDETGGTGHGAVYTDKETEI
ncbi:MAG: DNA polymerase IV [Clostridiales bacterium]|nr:DNA polymerase IV [Clostridiales bacterium]